MRGVAKDLLNPPSDSKRLKAQNHDIQVAMALASLRGLEYKFGRLHGEPVDASTYLDWKTFRFTPRADDVEFVSPEGLSAVDFALASSANALGFPPRRIDRPGDEPTYVANGIVNFPPEGRFWYTDGGTINNEPLGQSFDLSNDVDDRDPLGDDEQRLHILVHPHPTSPPGPNDPHWASASVKPAWTMTVARAFKLQTTQSVFTDLRHAEKTNSRLEWTSRLAELLSTKLPDTHDTRDALTAFIDKVGGEKAALEARVADAVDADPVIGLASSGTSVKDLLERALGLASGLGGKRPVAVEVVSPITLPEAHQPIPETGRLPTAESLLAGEFLFHFGGFLDERLRLSDFGLGYRSMRAWLDGGLVRNGLDKHAANHALSAVDARYENAWDRRYGDASLRNFPPPPGEQRKDRKRRRRLYRQLARVAFHEGIWHGLLGRDRSIFRP
jgi:hypothetical protein